MLYFYVRPPPLLRKARVREAGCAIPLDAYAAVAAGSGSGAYPRRLQPAPGRGAGFGRVDYNLRLDGVLASGRAACNLRLDGALASGRAAIAMDLLQRRMAGVLPLAVLRCRFARSLVLNEETCLTFSCRVTP